MTADAGENYSATQLRFLPSVIQFSHSNADYLFAIDNTSSNVCFSNYTCISYYTCKSALPNIYVQFLRVHSTQGRVWIYKAKHKSLC